MESLWDKTYKCPICGNEFTSKKVRIDSVKISGYDDDLKPNYVEVNPFLYEIVVCSNCCYAEYEPKFEENVNILEKEKIVDALEKLKGKLSNVKKHFTGERDIDLALKAYGIVVILSTVTKRYCKLADAYLKIAWLFREKEDKEQENIALAHALRSFEECYLKSNLPEGKPEEKVLFYLGELNRYFERRAEAVKWFSILVKKYGRSSSYYAKVGRDRWQSLRQ
ncbi:hypothetical protein SU69_07900 [Thermosipho melanesiensis]|uniref:Uncharacterized protein-like protein n=2 Tax=Thermosipho melanesiensis TaxID=46541 RepID=A6LNA0_THEM4|nr:DUF2225 domain-containing protein [Thermosipho melanesiensis]ABR31401.1 Uncharacterized protein-like protein [Thermosipho melanesiensis BI429]APT74460.1 hypothetical protein BW47_08255 [Thermosipho melanesiensis]OOC36420.1 hypothetical protein SU68_07970 [Thermosipho melanesiensis]OOC37238.1 hypothetical protein SU69_07900 [Thermosipho melanesiensis]OOC37990.1 hypothetical protein SU70_07910 [Thermosipho melanesiensis]